MLELTPKIFIDGLEIDFINAGLSQQGTLKAGQLDFTMPTSTGVGLNFWNKEVTMFMNTTDAVPLFRGWIKRVKENYNEIQIHAEDAIGYLIKGGEEETAKVALDDKINLDGLTGGAAIKKAIELSKLDSKLKTDYIGDTNPIISTSKDPMRGTFSVLDIIKRILSASVNTDTLDLPRPNIAKLIDDGTNSQFVIELESDVDNSVISHTYNEYDNITNLNIINRKVPTVIIVNGNGVKGTFTHDSAIEALDRSYIEVTNNNLLSPAACKDFAQKIFKANLKTQYEYTFDTFEGVYLPENSVIRVVTGEDEYDGNYRVLGRNISFSPSSYKMSVLINRKPPTLAEYINSRDN
jgi:hypothetical protein|tara:strand:+ start:1850 stop:2902 length:1053 start_codon:yes stop_codon:yes gene_type:complete